MNNNISIKCQFCNEELLINKAQEGMTIQCPKCKKEIQLTVPVKKGKKRYILAIGCLVIVVLFVAGCSYLFIVFNRLSKSEQTPSQEELLAFMVKPFEDNPSAESQFSAGIMYLNHSDNNPNNVYKAIECLKKAAEQNHPRAQTLIGEFYFRGKGYPQDYSAAVQWYKKAANQNEPYAQAALGMCYLKGMGVPQDVSQAKKWLQKAAQKGNTKAKEILSEIKD